MRRTISGWSAVGAAVVLLLAGCSSSVAGSAQAGSTPPTTTSTSSSAETTTVTSQTVTSETGTSETESSTTEESSTTASSTDTETTEDSGTSTRTSSTQSSAATRLDTATLDTGTEKWFTAFCGRAADVAQYVSPNTKGQTLKQAQATVVDAYRNISISSSTSVGLLQAIPAPTVDGGADLQSNAIESFTAVSDVYGRGAQTIAALAPRSVADLKKAIDAVEAEATATIPNSMAKVDQSVVDAARRLPACKDVLGGG